MLFISNWNGRTLRGHDHLGARRGVWNGLPGAREDNPAAKDRRVQDMADKDSWRSRRPRKRGFDDDFPMADGGGWAPPPSFAPSRPSPMTSFGGPETGAVVKWFNGEKGFGFVEVEGGSGDAFLHVSVLQRAGADTVAPGANLRVRVGPGQKGQQVTEVLEIKEGTAPPPSRSGGMGGGPRFAAPPPGAGEEMRGIVKWYNPQKGFGFVTPESGGKDVFIHATALERSGMPPLAEGQTVTMTVVQGRKGPEAATVRGD
jgi:CspA family cold shock protein